MTQGSKALELSLKKAQPLHLRPAYASCSTYCGKSAEEKPKRKQKLHKNRPREPSAHQRRVVEKNNPRHHLHSQCPLHFFQEPWALTSRPVKGQVASLLCPFNNPKKGTLNEESCSEYASASGSTNCALLSSIYSLRCRLNALSNQDNWWYCLRPKLNHLSNLSSSMMFCGSSKHHQLGFTLQPQYIWLRLYKGMNAGVQVWRGHSATAHENPSGNLPQHPRQIQDWLFGRR